MKNASRIIIILIIYGFSFNNIAFCGQLNLNPQISVNVFLLQKTYQKYYRDINYSGILSEETLQGKIEKSEKLLYRFAEQNSEERDFFRVDMYIAAEQLLDALYFNRSLAEKYVPVGNNESADKKLKILSVALLLRLVSTTKFYETEVLNLVLDKIMEKSFIRSARAPMATANFHYYIKLKNQNWYYDLWVSILHELGHNIRDNVLTQPVLPSEDNHIDSISEFFADLCPYIVSLDMGWVETVVNLKKINKRKYMQSKTTNGGVLIDSHMASQSQWYKLLQGVSIAPDKGTLEKLIFIFYGGLSKQYNEEKEFISWIYKINGFSPKNIYYKQKPRKRFIAKGVDEIILAELSIAELQKGLVGHNNFSLKININQVYEQAI